MPRPPLEAQLAALTQEFVGRLVEAIRNASFAEVASLPGPKVAPVGGAKPPSRQRKPPASPQQVSSHTTEARVRQTAAHRAELGDRVVRTLQGAQEPLGVRALSSELGVPPDLLAAPLRELRAAGRIRKHGEKRATTYSMAAD
jgi:hypothetical protein